MVYDIPRNYIGDTHWREDYPVQDGDEFELDRPVIVQVGEQVGSVEQDLTGLLEKRHKKDSVLERRPELSSSSPPVPLVASGPRAGNVIPTPLRPKSLNALLGTPKGRIGRASLPKYSPYELRRGVENAERTLQPYAKRQRVESPAESSRPAIEDQCQRKNLLEKRVGNVNKEIVDINQSFSTYRDPCSDQQESEPPRHIPTPPLPTSDSTTFAAPIRGREARQGNSKTPFREDHDKVHSSRLQAATAEHRLPAQPNGSKTQKPNHVSELESPRTSAYETLLEPLEIINIPPAEGMGASLSSERAEPKTRLQMASRKPRRKLMYRDLLPQDAPVTGNFSNSTVLNGKSNGRASIAERRDKRSIDTSSKHQPDGQEDSATRLLNHYDRTKQRNERSLQLCPESVFHELDKSKTIGIRCPNLSMQNSKMLHAKDILNRSRLPSVEAVERDIPKAVPSIHDTNLALARMDEILFSPSQSQRSTGEGRRRLVDGGSSTRRPETSLTVPEAPAPVAQELSETLKVSAEHGSSITQVPSSQFFETQILPSSEVQPSPAMDKDEYPSEVCPVTTSAKNSAPGSPVLISSQMRRSPVVEYSSDKHLDKAEASRTDSPATKRPKMAANVPTITSSEDRSATLCEADVPVLEAARLVENSSRSNHTQSFRTTRGRVALDDDLAEKAATGLPHFRPLRSTAMRQRSPIKKTVSDISQTTNTKPASGLGKYSAASSNASGSKEQVVNPWSIEAWDLFGCGRDGVAVDFGTFRMREGV